MGASIRWMSLPRVERVLSSLVASTGATVDVRMIVVPLGKADINMAIHREE